MDGSKLSLAVKVQMLYSLTVNNGCASQMKFSCAVFLTAIKVAILLLTMLLLLVVGGGYS